MAKYYVSTGGFKAIVNKKTIEDGLLAGLHKIIEENNCPDLGLIMSISERGFDSECENDDTLFASTSVILKKIKMDDIYGSAN